MAVVPRIRPSRRWPPHGRTLLTDDQQSLVILTANTEGDHLDRELSDPATTVVVYKGGGRLPDLAAPGGRRGPDAAVLGELIGMPGDRVTVMAGGLTGRPATCRRSSSRPPATATVPPGRRRAAAPAETPAASRGHGSNPA